VIVKLRIQEHGHERLLRRLPGQRTVVLGGLDQARDQLEVVPTSF